MTELTEYPAGALASAAGRTVAGMHLSNDSLRIAFTDGSALFLEDIASGCCEHRYFTCDDDLPGFVGEEFAGLSVVDIPDALDSSGEHNMAVCTALFRSGLPLTLVTHNEHNGYYGGMTIRATLVEVDPVPE